MVTTVCTSCCFLPACCYRHDMLPDRYLKLPSPFPAHIPLACVHVSIASPQYTPAVPAIGDDNLLRRNQRQHRRGTAANPALSHLRVRAEKSIDTSRRHIRSPPFVRTLMHQETGAGGRVRGAGAHEWGTSPGARRVKTSGTDIWLPSNLLLVIDQCCSRGTRAENGRTGG